MGMENRRDERIIKYSGNPEGLKLLLEKYRPLPIGDPKRVELKRKIKALKRKTRGSMRDWGGNR